MPDFITRIAKLEDLDQVASLFDQYRQFYEQTPNIALAKPFIGDRIKNQQSVILVVEIDQKIHGFCQLYPTFCSVEAAPIMVLYDLFVAKTARKTGLGAALILAARAYAKEHHFVRLDLSTAKTNHAAQALYESLGWVRDEVFYHYSLAVD